MTRRLKDYIPDPVKSAERNLRDRIERFPGNSPAELAEVSQAREMLDRRLFTIGERHMFNAQILYKARTGIEL